MALVVNTIDDGQLPVVAFDLDIFAVNQKNTGILGRVVPGNIGAVRQMGKHLVYFSKDCSDPKIRLIGQRAKGYSIQME